VLLSVVIPVFHGEETLASVVAELAPFTTEQRSPAGIRYRVSEVLLVWDHGPGKSDEVVRALAEEYSWIKPLWLSRNFGQHAATLAGMTSSHGDWIVTLDEDGQQNPADMAVLLDTAYRDHAQLVYGAPVNPPPHGAVRNIGSSVAKTIFVRFLADQPFAAFNSYRLVLGEVGRSVAAYTGAGVYLDVALSWVVGDVATAPVTLRAEGRPQGSYNYRRLAGHFGRLLVSSGTRPLVFVSWLGVAFTMLGVAVSIYVLAQRLSGDVPVTGWASTFVALMLIGGAILFSLGIVAQYVGAATNMSLGKPLYVILSDPMKPFPKKIQSVNDPRD
jgi:glycosyltransferase involved in cell wall biosynthesis